MSSQVISLSGGGYDIWRREELRSELDAIIASEHITIDLRTTTFMDAGAVGLLIGFAKRVRRQSPGARITLRNAPSIVRRVLRITAADKLFDFTA
ncbi:MAG TPA: STAS domain-containing protein [Candidatus Baltobacteraceae bacterium]|nr:STAS domain-containing protein [Candidatus Baltobacteraceae bacterium]